jgi:hypothetical protein
MRTTRGHDGSRRRSFWECTLSGTGFHLDVGLGDVTVVPVEFVRARDWLGFAAIVAPDVPMIQWAQQFAEKLRADTLSRPAAPDSRVRDVVDLAVLIRSGTLDSTRVVGCVRGTFAWLIPILSREHCRPRPRVGLRRSSLSLKSKLASRLTTCG